MLDAPELRGQRIVAGTVAVRGEGSGAHDDAELEAARWRLWGKPGRDLLDAACEALRTRAAAIDVKFLLTPTVDGILSDIPSLATFLRQQPGETFSAIIEPAAMLSVEMLPRAEDHLHRVVQAANALDGVQAVVVSNLAHAPDGGLSVCGVGEGILSNSMLAGVFRGARDGLSGKACIVRGDAGVVRAWLEGASPETADS